MAARRRTSVVAPSSDLKARGFAVTFYPFVMMDIPAGNTLPDPYGGTRPAGLSLARAHHLSPAPGQAGTSGQDRGGRDADRGLLRHAAPADFAIAGDSVDLFRARRMVASGA